MASHHSRPNHLPASAHRKSRWESSTSLPSSRNLDKPTDNHKAAKPGNPSPKLPPGVWPYLKTQAVNNYTGEPALMASSNGQCFPPDQGFISQPSYGFHMLDRRTFVLADGSVRSYFALPPDYHDLTPRFLPLHPLVPDGRGSCQRFPSMSPEGLRVSTHHPLKRKFEDSSEIGYQANSPFWRDIGIREGHIRTGKVARVDGVAHKHIRVDPVRLKRTFLHFVKAINGSEGERKRFLEDGKRLRCFACSGSSKEFPDMHALIMHTYNSDNGDLNVDHLGLHKALCVLMGWNYAKPPDNTRAYQFLHADEAIANQEDLIIWPPIVIVHNTITGKGKDGRMEGLGSKTMDAKVKEMGFPGGKSKSLYGRDGHQGVTLVKFSGNPSGLKEAVQLGQHFEKEKHGRRAWTRLQHVLMGKDDEKHPDLVKVDRNGEKKRIFYGYLAAASDLCKIDLDSRTKVSIESRRERETSK